MRRSRLNDRLRDAQEGNPTQYYAYGDTAYAAMSHVKRGFKEMVAGLSQSQSQENEAMSVCGLGVEHMFGKVCNLWGFLDHKRTLKLKQYPVGELYLVGVLLVNIHICRYGRHATECYHELPPSMKACFQLHSRSSG
ncbi:unnamed protein product [Discosporangium mesarthrocarpum]